MENEQKQNGEPFRRRRRRKKKGGGNQNNPNAANNQNVQNTQNNQSVKKPQPQPENGQKQNKNPQNGQKKSGQPQNQPKKNQQQGKKNKPQQVEHKKDTYAYVLDGNLYINLTNKCSNGCDFCVRNERTSYFGHELWIKNGDPTAEKVIAQMESLGELTSFKEVVFCGFGEPTYRMEELCEICDYARAKGVKTRLNTNGQGNLINKRDILPELKGKIDFINVSLNAPDAESYQKICRSMFRESGFDAMVEFAKNAKRAGFSCRFSVVDCIGEDALASCKKLAESVNVPLYIRKYIAES